PRGRRIRSSVELSGGALLAVTEEEISAAGTALGLAGLDVEPTSAVAFAGALKWLREGGEEALREIESNGAPLIALTGAGLKATS
ncbi:MAG TPA: threonine synthase, partial [Candidatus Polarisedimenticolia bacterium]|nr:threonine synthase [Candidatus Polarisedimenticolia bacterium]